MIFFLYKSLYFKIKIFSNLIQSKYYLFFENLKLNYLELMLLNTRMCFLTQWLFKFNLIKYFHRLLLIMNFLVEEDNVGFHLNED